MAEAILYIFDSASDTKKLLGYCIKKNIRKVFLCPITSDQNAVLLLVKDLSSVRNCDVEILPYLKYFNKTAFSERDNFIRFVAKLGQEPKFGNKNFREYFRYPNSLLSVWWFSSIVEKNPLKSNVYHNLIKLLTILKLRKECSTKKIILDMSSRELSSAIVDNQKNGEYDCEDFKRYRRKLKIVSFFVSFSKASRYYLYLGYKIFILFVNTRGLKSRRNILKNAQYVAITYFPLIDQESLKEKRFINKYYNSLQTVLENRYRDRFIWFAMVSDIGDFSFNRSVKLGRQLNLWGYPIYFMEEWINLKDLLIILAYYIYFAGRFIIKTPSLSEKLEYSQGGLNIWSLFEKDWFSSFAGDVLISGIVYYRIFKNISDKLKDGAVAIYLAENQPWEKALNFAFHDKRELKAVGIIHTTVPQLFLQLFDSKEELQKDSGREFAMPNPDYLACNGKIPLELLRRTGWDKEKTFLWFAIRYQHLRKHLQKKIPWERRQNKILVILSVNLNELKEMLFYIHQAFNGRKNYQILIKEHYLFSIQSFIRHLNIDFSEDTFIISKENLEEILSTAKAMIVTSSSAALESIALGCPVVIPRLSGVIDMNPLSGISDFPVYVNSSKELQVTVEDIIKRRESPLSYEKCKNFVENYFEFPDSENELIEKIEAHFVSGGKIL